MSDLARPPMDHILAGLLNGVVMSLLGCAFPALLAWAVIARHGGQGALFPLADPASVLGEAIAAFGAAYACYRAVRFGVKLIRENLAHLRSAGRRS